MSETVKQVQQYYNGTVQDEWNRIANRPEFLLTCRMLNRYIKSGDKVLDIGGGPGRYSLHLAARGCDVELMDLSEENVRFAREEAERQGLPIKASAGDARYADTLIHGQFDHVLLMGPLYHLLEEADRVKAVRAALNLLKPGGVLFVSFISMMGGMVYEMKFAPEVRASSDPLEMAYTRSFLEKKSFGGAAFTHAFFIEQSEVLPFMSQFPLEKLHLFGQEGILSPCEDNIMAQPKHITDLWLDLCEAIVDREEFLSWSEHIMYVGMKTE